MRGTSLLESHSQPRAPPKAATVFARSGDTLGKRGEAQDSQSGAGKFQLPLRHFLSIVSSYHLTFASVTSLLLTSAPAPIPRPRPLSIVAASFKHASKLPHISTMSATQEFTYSDVSEHNSKNDLYMVVHDKVYNASSFVDEHPYVPPCPRPTVLPRLRRGQYCE
jgi:hypothetical protein